MSLSTRPPRKAAGVRGRLRAHDPFELIRWLALSQTDPRKALAELVQNCLDARADHVRITRFRTRGVSCLKIVDDGEGVIPELGRVEALQYIATHVGHSRKRKLSPQERLQLMTQGQYGIGLLGFWSLGEMLEMRSVVPGQRPERLVLYRDKPTYRIEPVPGRLPLDDRHTEILVSGIHADAQRLLTGPRTAEYLGSELRGQLLERSVSIVIEDRLARKRSHRSIPVPRDAFSESRWRDSIASKCPGGPTHGSRSTGTATAPATRKGSGSTEPERKSPKDFGRSRHSGWTVPHGPTRG
jgi:hypothetical protein